MKARSYSAFLATFPIDGGSRRGEAVRTLFELLKSTILGAATLHARTGGLVIVAGIVASCLVAPSTLVAQPQDTKRYLPVRIEQPSKRVPTRPFTLAEIRKRRPDATLETKLTLANGNVLTVHEALNFLNKLEPQYNAIGRSLRDKTRPPLRFLSGIEVKPTLTAFSLAPPSNVPFTAFPAGDWVITAGDSAFIAAEISFQTALLNTARELTQSQSIAAGGYIFGRYFPLVSANERGTIPPELNGCRLLASVSTTGVQQVPSTAACTEGSQLVSAQIPQQSVSLTSATSFTQPLLGVLEVTVEAALTIDGDTSSSVIGEPHQLNAVTFVSPAIWVSFEILGGFYVVDAGAAADLLLARYMVTQRSTTAATEDPSPSNWTSTKISWNTVTERSVRSLDGSISLVFQVDIPFIGEQSIEWVVYTWQGTSIPLSTVTWGPHTGTRPGVCLTSSGESGALCSGVCVNLLSSVNNCGTCGHVCKTPENAVNMRCSYGECRACLPACDGIAPYRPDHCGGTCPPCSERRSGTAPVWCDQLKACVSSEKACTGIIR